MRKSQTLSLMLPQENHNLVDSWCVCVCVPDFARILHSWPNPPPPIRQVYGKIGERRVDLRESRRLGRLRGFGPARGGQGDAGAELARQPGSRVRRDWHENWLQQEPSNFSSDSLAGIVGCSRLWSGFAFRGPNGRAIFGSGTLQKVPCQRKQG